MITKEELLQKGISEELADEIIADFESNTEEDNSLLALQKALDDGSEMDDLIKAEGNEGKEKDDKEDDDEDYDEKYMKKYMKRYMKSNAKSCQKMMKELGASQENMQKAISEIDENAEGAVVEMVDLSPFLNSQTELNVNMVKAISDLAEQVEIISSKTEKSYDLMQKAAKVQVEQAKELNTFLSVPTGRKGVTTNVDMKKAIEPGTSFSPEDNQLIYQSLLKAVKGGDRTAGQVISAFEVHGKNANKLNKTQKQFIHEIISKEAN